MNTPNSIDHVTSKQNRIRLHNHASIANIEKHSAIRGRKNEYDDALEVQGSLSKAKSKDQLAYMKYGAKNIRQEGRKESQRLLIDRYKRDLNNEQRRPEPSYLNLDMYK